MGSSLTEAWPVPIAQIPFFAKRKGWRGVALLAIGGKNSLMPNIFRRGGVNGVLRDIRRVIADPLEMPRDEHQVQITAQLVGILSHPFDQSSAGACIHFVELFIARLETAAQFNILLHVSVNAVLE